MLQLALAHFRFSRVPYHGHHPRINSTQPTIEPSNAHPSSFLPASNTKTSRTAHISTFSRNISRCPSVLLFSLLSFSSFSLHSSSLPCFENPCPQPIKTTLVLHQDRLYFSYSLAWDSRPSRASSICFFFSSIGSFLRNSLRISSDL